MPKAHTSTTVALVLSLCTGAGLRIVCYVKHSDSTESNLIKDCLKLFKVWKCNGALDRCLSLLLEDLRTECNRVLSVLDVDEAGAVVAGREANGVQFAIRCDNASGPNSIATGPSCTAAVRNCTAAGRSRTAAGPHSVAAGCGHGADRCTYSCASGKRHSGLPAGRFNYVLTYKSGPVAQPSWIPEGAWDGRRPRGGRH